MGSYLLLSHLTRGLLLLLKEGSHELRIGLDDLNDLLLLLRRVGGFERLEQLLEGLFGLGMRRDPARRQRGPGAPAGDAGTHTASARTYATRHRRLLS